MKENNINNDRKKSKKIIDYIYPGTNKYLLLLLSLFLFISIVIFLFFILLYLSKSPSFDELSKTEGVLEEIYYQKHRKGPGSLFIVIRKNDGSKEKYYSTKNNHERAIKKYIGKNVIVFSYYDLANMKFYSYFSEITFNGVRLLNDWEKQRKNILKDSEFGKAGMILVIVFLIIPPIAICHMYNFFRSNILSRR